MASIIFTMLAIGEVIFNGTLNELITLPLLNRSFLIAVLYQGIGCSILAFSLSNVAISLIGVNRTSAFIGIEKVVSIIAGAWVLNEPFNRYQIIGAIVIIVGVYYANAAKERTN